MDSVIDRLASSGEPVIQYKLQVDVLGEDPDSEKMQKLQKKIRSSKLSRQLLSEK